MYAVLLTFLLVLFIARVAGQLVTLLYAPPWLPPMEERYSGLVPYPLLLPVQIAIVALMIFMILQVRRRVPPSPRLARNITLFAVIYAAAMLVRFILLRTRHPELQWYRGGMIPIFFHWVLAAFLLTYASARRVTPAARIR